MGGEETEIGDATTDGAARGGELRAVRRLSHLRAPAAAHRGLEPLGEGRRPAPRRQAAALATELHRRARRRRAGRATRRARRRCPSGRSCASGRSGPTRVIGLESPPERAARAARAARLRRDDDARRRPDVARPRRHARDRRRRGGRALPPRRRARSRCRSGATMTGRLTREQRLRRRVEDVARRRRLARRTRPRSVPATRPGGLPLPEPITVELRPCCARRCCRRWSMPARRNLDAGNAGIALFEIAHVYLPGGGRLPDEPVASRGPRGRLRAREGRRRGALPRAQAGRVRARRDARCSTREAARDEAGVVGELHPALLEGTWGAFELDLARSSRERTSRRRTRTSSPSRR